MRQVTLTGMALFILAGAFAQRLVIPPVDNSTLEGKAMFGYQGWFTHPNDNGPMQIYFHWGNMDVVDRENLEVEMYPDLREFCEDEKFPTAYTFSNGEVAPVFSSFNRQTVMRHMKWVRDYNTDGVFIQRFITDVQNPKNKEHRDSVAVSVMKGCEQYGRVFAMMYDGVHDRMAENIKKDWMYLVDSLGIINSDRYLKHNGLPLVSLWGYTVYDDATVDKLEELIEFFKNNPEPKYRASVKLGLNDFWFLKDQRWLNAFAKADVISPWSVGRYANETQLNIYVSFQLLPGRNWCNQRGILFVPVIWPGFSWYNLKDGGYEEEGVKNPVKRNGGKFLWMQAYKTLGVVGSKSLYFAMFDEVDESTAFMKTAENAEQSPAQEFWLNLDADGYDLPSDWYLRIAGKITETLRGNLPNLPTLGTPKPNGVTIRPVMNDCKLDFIFPDFEDASQLEISLDGGVSFPYSVPDNAGHYEIGNLEAGTYEVFVRDALPNSVAVPMGRVCVSSPCLVTAVENGIPVSQSIAVFPSITDAEFRFTGLPGTYDVLVYDALGKRQMLFPAVRAGDPLDIANLPGAMYWLFIRGEHASYYAKVLKR